MTTATGTTLSRHNDDLLNNIHDSNEDEKHEGDKGR